VAIVTHQNADPDALCSAYALGYLLRRLRRGVVVHLVAPQGISKVTKRVLEHLHIRLHHPESLDEYDIVFTVDTNTLLQLAEYGMRLRDYEGEVIVVDHHAPDPKTLEISTHAIIDDKAVSVSQIVYSLYKEFKIPVSRPVAWALFLGIAYDTRHFALATSTSFKIAGDLVRRGVDAAKAIRLLQVPITESERIARLKGAQRLKITRVGRWILASTFVGSHQASVARGLIMLGADVAMVSGGKKGDVQVSLRSTQDFYDSTGTHLGRHIARAVGELIHGAGGGHAIAAGIRGRDEEKSALTKCLQVLTEELKKKM
jgi:nanoRNase/pAp phosphatase (c-di-AMP/oligoRNAs hydrolase)